MMLLGRRKHFEEFVPTKQFSLVESTYPNWFRSDLGFLTDAKLLQASTPARVMLSVIFGWPGYTLDNDLA